MKKLFFSMLFLSTIIPHAIWAKCNTQAIGVIHQSGFGISIGGGGTKTGYYDKNTINVPLTINDQQACFMKKSSFELKAEVSAGEKEVDKGKISISPLNVSFENIPSPHVKQYLYVEKNESKNNTIFHTMAFICAGEIPLSIEAISDNYSRILRKSQEVEVSTHMVFATGAAAENLNRQKNWLKSQPTFNFFAKLYQEKTNREIEEIPCCNHKAPNLLTSTSISSISNIDERHIAAGFSTMGEKVVNGCATEFSEIMKDYLLENYSDNESLKDYKVSKKWFSDILIFEWK